MSISTVDAGVISMAFTVDSDNLNPKLDLTIDYQQLHLHKFPDSLLS